jgi:cytochrome c-type biogenesis protein CcmH/NrfG
MKKRTVLVILMVVLAGFLPSLVSAGNSALEEAQAQFGDRHYDKAISLIEAEIKKSGESADLLVLMADSYLALGEKRNAENTYRQALYLEPGHVDGSLNLSMILVANRERREAIALIKGVLAENPNHARAHFCLGMAYNAKSDINDAFEQYKILKKLDKELAAELYDTIFLQ